jgi:hypothetical protein
MRRPSMWPSTTSVTGSAAAIRTGSAMRTVVAVAATGRPRSVGSGLPSARQTSSISSTGNAIAVSLSQYWNACTTVIERIPLTATPSRTTAATTAAPIQRGAPVTVCNVSPAPWNCGSR